MAPRSWKMAQSSRIVEQQNSQGSRRQSSANHMYQGKQGDINTHPNQKRQHVMFSCSGIMHFDLSAWSSSAGFASYAGAFTICVWVYITFAETNHLNFRSKDPFSGPHLIPDLTSMEVMMLCFTSCLTGAGCTSGFLLLWWMWKSHFASVSAMSICQTPPLLLGN